MRHLCNRRVIVSLVANNSNNTDLPILIVFLGSEPENSPLDHHIFRKVAYNFLSFRKTHLQGNSLEFPFKKTKD